MSRRLRISAKNLAQLNMPALCPRCTWIRLHARLPYQIFPGIFSSIDAYTKRVIHGFFDRQDEPPGWLAALGELSGYVRPPHHSKFNRVDEINNILLTGSPDGVFVRPDGSHLIVDYKTSRYTKYQDRLYPLYEAQLNAYAFIGEERGMAPVSGLALLYTEPLTDETASAARENQRQGGFAMGFAAKVVEVPLKPDMVPRLLAQARAIYDEPAPPDGLSDCDDCQLLDNLLTMTAP